MNDDNMIAHRLTVAGERWRAVQPEPPAPDVQRLRAVPADATAPDVARLRPPGAPDIAVPSGQRRWSLPQPVGDQIFVQFPFSYDADRVLGICAYLRDYMRQNSEASTGKFLARLGPVGWVPALGEPNGAEPAGSGASDGAVAVAQPLTAARQLGV